MNHTLIELIGMLLGADGTRSLLADAERADKLAVARESAARARAFVDEAGSSRPPMIQAVSQALIAIWALSDVLAAEPAPRRAPAVELQPGDVVRLRSGGPAMTVEGEGDVHDESLCSWFKDGDAYAESFMRVALIRVVDEQRAAQRERERRSVLVDAERLLNDTRQAIEGRPLAAIQAAELAERLVGVRDRIATALAEDA